ncbi:hypothetical protein [Proteus mirabilis]
MVNRSSQAAHESQVQRLRSSQPVGASASKRELSSAIDEMKI